MSNSKEILDRINSIKTMKQITQTMKLISISKFTKSKIELERIRIYQKTLNSIISDCFVENINDANNKKLLFIPISGNRGFCGAFNNNVCKKSIDFLKTIKSEEVEIIPIGKKINLYLKKNHYCVIEDFVNILESYNFSNIDNFAGRIIEKLVKGKYNKLVFVFNSFENTSSNINKIEEIKNINLKCGIKISIFEPNKEDIKKILIAKILKTKILNILLQSNTAENNARMINMGKASDNADELTKTLRILYNQTRQTTITNEIIEITNGSIFKR